MCLHAVLQIKFEMPEYTFLEPLLGLELPVKGVSLVKNRQTELTYDVLIRARPVDQLEPNRDYGTNIGEEGSLITFFPNVQKIAVFGQDLSVHILPDVIPEGEEVLEISSRPVDNPGPAYQLPVDTVGTVTRIVIVESKHSLLPSLLQN